MSKLPQTKFLYTKEEILNISNLGDVLKEIRARLIKDGVSIEDARKQLWRKHKKNAKM